MEHLKNNISLILTVIALVSAMFTFDTRYAHSEDVKRDAQQTQEIVKQTQMLVSQTTKDLRRSLIEDKLFEIDLKNKLTQVDIALKERYLRQIKELK